MSLGKPVSIVRVSIASHRTSPCYSLKTFLFCWPLCLQLLTNKLKKKFGKVFKEIRKRRGSVINSNDRGLRMMNFTQNSRYITTWRKISFVWVLVLEHKLQKDWVSSTKEEPPRSRQQNLTAVPRLQQWVLVSCNGYNLDAWEHDEKLGARKFQLW